MHLAVFAKYWAPGEAKTRLAATFGRRAAARLARAFLKATLDRLAAIKATRHLVVAPKSSQRAFERIARGRYHVSLQSTGLLGERLQGWFESRLSNGATRVVVLGADSPDLPLEYVTAAFDELEHSQAVIGPAHDGGYYLLGLRDQVLPLFDCIDWGTSAVFDQTLERLQSLHANFAVLPSWHDVDTPDDLFLLSRHLSTRSSADPACARLLRTIVRVTGIRP
jgi:rSAM/selenodomain-associated transferase 1